MKKPKRPTEKAEPAQAPPTIMHTELAGMGVVQVAVLERPVPTTKDPDRWLAKLRLFSQAGDRDVYYTCLTQQCADLLNSEDLAVGSAFAMTAEGADETATLTYVGGPGDAVEPPGGNQGASTQPLPGLPQPGPAPAREEGEPPKPTNNKGIQCVELRYDRTVNLGNYESVKLGITLSLVDGEKAADAFQMAKKFVEGRLPKQEEQPVQNQNVTQRLPRPARY